jgi:hypothetical protein
LNGAPTSAIIDLLYTTLKSVAIKLEAATTALGIPPDPTITANLLQLELLLNTIKTVDQPVSINLPYPIVIQRSTP